MFFSVGKNYVSLWSCWRILSCFKIQLCFFLYVISLFLLCGNCAQLCIRKVNNLILCLFFNSLIISVLFCNYFIDCCDWIAKGRAWANVHEFKTSTVRPGWLCKVSGISLYKNNNFSQFSLKSPMKASLL